MTLRLAIAAYLFATSAAAALFIVWLEQPFLR